MNCDNGRIGLEDELLAEGADPDKLVPIRMAQATARQRGMGRVSPHDNRSELGKLRVETNKMTRNQRKAQRRKLKKLYG